MTTKAHQRYRTKAGIIVPGVTTVLNILSKPALIYWAWDLGMHGEDFRKVVSKAGDIGTIAHYLVECILNAVKPDEPTMDEYSGANIKTAKFASDKFEDWWHTQGFETFDCIDKEGDTVNSVEVQLVDEEYMFGGTIDCVARNSQGEYMLLDIKTSKGIYDEMKYQLAAYWRMWDENNPDKPISTACIIHLDKIKGNLNFHNFGTVDHEWEIFKACRTLYGLLGKTDKKRNSDRARKTNMPQYRLRRVPK